MMMFNDAEARLLLFFFVFFVALFLGGRGLLLFFFHLLADLILTLGADLSALGAFGFNDFLAAQPLHVAPLSSVARAPSSTDDAQVAALAVAPTPGPVFKNPVH